MIISILDIHNINSSVANKYMMASVYPILLKYCFMDNSVPDFIDISHCLISWTRYRGVRTLQRIVHERAVWSSVPKSAHSLQRRKKFKVSLIILSKANLTKPRRNLRVLITQAKDLNEYILMVLFVLLLETLFSCKRNLKVWPLKRKTSMSTF